MQLAVTCADDCCAIAQGADLRALLAADEARPASDSAPVGEASRDAGVGQEKDWRGPSKRGGARPRTYRRPWGHEGHGVSQLAQCMRGVLRQNAGIPYTMSTTAAEAPPVVLVERAGCRNQALFCVGFTSPKEAAVVWRGECSRALCTCFESAEDATMLSVDGKTGSCIHARAYLEASEAGHALPPSARHSSAFAVKVKSGGSSQAVVVWDGMIFSVVTTDKGAADLCLAPACRVSPHQCGHVRQAAEELRKQRGVQPRDRSQTADADGPHAVALHLENLDGGEASEDEVVFLRHHLGAVGGQDVENFELGHDETTGGGAAPEPPPPLPAADVPPPQQKWTLSTPCKRNFLPCPQEVAAGVKWRYTSELLGRVLAHPEDSTMVTLLADAVASEDAFDPTAPLYEPACPKCKRAAPPVADVSVVDACILSDSRSGVEVPVSVGSWTCNECKMMVNFDGAGVGLFVIPRLDAKKRLLVFTRSFCDDLLSYVVTSRSSFSAATRYMASVIPGFRHRRQAIVDLGLMYTSHLDIPALLFRCPLCMDFPLVIIMDGQALGFRIPREWNVLRLSHNVPVLPLPLTDMTVFAVTAQSALVQRITRNGSKLSTTELAAGMSLYEGAAAKSLDPIQEAAVVLLSFFFPLDATAASVLRAHPPANAGTSVAGFFHLSASQRDALRAHLTSPVVLAADEGAAAGGDDGREDDEGGGMDIADDDVGGGADSDAEGAAEDQEQGDGQGRVGRDDADGRGGSGGDGGVAADDAVAGTRSLGGGGAEARNSPGALWQSRSGSFAPVFDIIPKDDGPAWTSVRWFLRALLGEPVVNLFVSCDAAAVRGLVSELRATGDSDWTVHLMAVSDVAFVAHFLSRVAHVVSAYRSLRLAIAALFEFAINVEDKVDARFALSAEKASRAGKGENKEYCEMWQTTSPEKFAAYARSMPGMERLLHGDAIASMEVFPNLKRCRPGIWDNSAAKRRALYAEGQKLKRTAASAAREDAADKCNKNFPTDQKLTPGVYNVLCPHVVSYGFRVLTKAESVEDGISVVLERFSSIPKTIYYDMACKMNRNLMRRVRPLFRHHGVRCFMDRPHGKGHTCSLTNFADASLRQTLGKASTAAEVSHSIAIRFRPMLAYMRPATFLSFKSFQVATANLRAIYRLKQAGRSTENDHINFGEFFWSQLDMKCITADCICQYRPG